MMKTGRRAFLCNGQGQCLSALGAELLKQPHLLRRAASFSDAAGRSVPELLQSTVRPEDTLAVHLARVSHALLAYEPECESGPFALLAGHSLGELSALACAGLLDESDALRLAAVRGQALADASANTKGGMLALLGQPVAETKQLVHTFKQQTHRGDIWIANTNTPTQLVLSGNRADLEACSRHMEKHGLRAVMLATAGAFHSPLMTDAAEKVYAFANRLEWRPPRAACLSSMTGTLLEGTALAAHCALQIISPVRWVDVMETLHRADILSIVEDGPEGTLGSFFRAFPAEDWNVSVRPCAGTEDPVHPA